VDVQRESSIHASLKSEGWRGCADSVDLGGRWRHMLGGELAGETPRARLQSRAVVVASWRCDDNLPTLERDDNNNNI
jgi:hypothetical protein